MLLLLVFASVASAAHPSRQANVHQANKRALRHATFHPPVVVCDPRLPEAPFLQRVVRQTESVGGPVKRFKRSRLGFHQSSVSRIVRASHQDEQAVQNDTLAANFPIELALALRPIGAFVESLEQQPPSVAFSPRSPRGPPQRARHSFKALGGFVKFEVTDAGSLSRPEV